MATQNTNTTWCWKRNRATLLTDRGLAANTDRISSRIVVVVTAGKTSLFSSPPNSTKSTCKSIIVALAACLRFEWIRLTCYPSWSASKRKAEVRKSFIDNSNLNLISSYSDNEGETPALVQCLSLRSKEMFLLCFPFLVFFEFVQIPCGVVTNSEDRP